MTVDKKQRKRILKIFNRWATCLGMGWWSVDLVYETDRNEFRSETEGYEIVAHTVGRWEYRSATITFNMALVPDRTDKELETDIVHEICHILVMEMQEGEGEDYQKHVERTICSLASAFLWTRAEGYEKGGKATRKEKKG